MCLRTMLVVCCAMVYFGSGQANVLMTNSVYNNTNEPVVKQCAELFQYVRKFSKNNLTTQQTEF